MYTCEQAISSFFSGRMDETFRLLYAVNPNEPLPKQIKKRYAELVEQYMKQFAAPLQSDIMIFSAPGRTEVGGNHTDHQHGKVLCASVNLDMLACAAPNGSDYINVVSDGYPTFSVKLGKLNPNEREYGSSAALVAGLAACVAEKGVEIIGLNIYICSDIPLGSGLSSSAAYEVLLGNVLNYFCCESKFTAMEIACMGQYAENAFFGKPCGLMDQVASSIGSLSAIDFIDAKKPKVESIHCNLAEYGYALCIINTGADHADLTAEYSAITTELSAISSYFGKDSMRDVDEGKFYRSIKELRISAGDRAVLRAIHIFEENRRVERQITALQGKDFYGFLKGALESGHSSWMYLQNVIPSGANAKQEVALALAMCERLLNGSGVSRVHGGGFAGTIQAFVPIEALADFQHGIEKIFECGACHVLRFREIGGCAVSFKS